MIILMNKMSECHKHVLVTELIFCNNSKANIKKIQDIQGNATSGLAYKSLL